MNQTKTYEDGGDFLPKCVICETKRPRDSGVTKILAREKDYFLAHAWHCETCLFNEIEKMMQDKGQSFNKICEALTGQKVRGRIYKRYRASRGQSQAVQQAVKKLQPKRPKAQPKVLEPMKVKEQEPSVLRSYKSKEELPEDVKIFTEKDKDRFDIKDLIPKHGGDYIPRDMYGSTDIEIAGKAFDNRNDPKNQFIGLKVSGKTGCGKTHFAKEFAYMRGLPYRRIPLNGASTPEDLVGSYTPYKNGVVWKDGWLTLFMRYGGLLVLDEINMAQADILAILNSVLDMEKTLTLVQKDGETISAHKDFFVIATMNEDYEGTKPLNEALKDRFFPLEFDYNEKVEKKLVKDKKILELAGKIRALEARGEIETPLSTRQLLGYDFNKLVYGEEVATEIFLNRFPPQERKSIKEAKELIDSQGSFNYAESSA